MNPQTEGKLWAANNSMFTSINCWDPEKRQINDTALVREKQKYAMLIQKSCPSRMACNDSLINGLVWGGHKGPQLQGNKKIVSLKQCRESGRKTQENNHRMSNALH